MLLNNEVYCGYVSTRESSIFVELYSFRLTQDKSIMAVRILYLVLDLVANPQILKATHLKVCCFRFFFYDNGAVSTNLEVLCKWIAI